MIQWLRRHLKRSFDRMHNEKLKRNILQAVPFWIASVATGLIAVLYTRLFVAAEELTNTVFDKAPLMMLLLAPACFIISWYLVKKYAPYAGGSGIPQVMAAIELSGPKANLVIDKLLGLRVIAIKVLSSLILALGGGAIGREGPTIQISASIFKLIYQFLPKWWPQIARKNMIVTGAAAGLAAAFNTPLGGIVFAIEELTKTHFSYYKTAIFSSVIIAGLTAQALLGPYLYLGYPKVDHLSSSIFIAVILVGMLSGLLGSIVSKGILAIIAWKAKFKFTHHHLLFLTGCAILMAGLALAIDRSILGSGKDVMQKALFSGDKFVPWYTPILRTIGPLLSFTTGSAGGIFAPALSAGASVGSLIADWFQLSATNANMLILAGMVGFLTGVTRSPFTSVILVLEMTDRHNVIFHLILAGMVSGLISLLVDKHSLYDHLKVRYIHDLNEVDEKPKEAAQNLSVP